MTADHIKSESGAALLIALLMMGLAMLIGLAALSTSDDEVTIAGNEMQEIRSFYAAEAGLEMAAAALEREYDSTGVPPTVMPEGIDHMNECQVEFVSASDGPAEQRVMTTGSLAGLHALVKSFTMISTATSDIDNAKVVLSQSFETDMVPIFQFAVYYENDLWATPASDMTITGRVHCNGSMYLQAGTDMYFDGKVTAAGAVEHGFPGGLYSGTNGGVHFKDGSGSYQNMYQDGSWLDNSDPDWYAKASTLWAGNVRDEAFGQEELNVPLTNSSGDPHKIIERAAGNADSYEEKSDFKIIDGVPYSMQGGVWQNVSASLPAGTISSTSFYDAREKEWVTSTDIDMDLLSTSGYYPNNGVVYSSDQRGGYPVLRLRNGEEIKDALSVFSENPLYIEGDYNTQDKKPAAVIADVVTYLSNDWDDANSSGKLSSRTTSPTTVNVSMITGDLDTDVQDYSGGLANLPRFLEDWNKTKFTLHGSMVNLWRTKQADGQWSYGGGSAYYTAPTRDYRFDLDLNDPNNLPPETPVVRLFQRTGWKQEYVSFQ